MLILLHLRRDWHFQSQYLTPLPPFQTRSTPLLHSSLKGTSQQAHKQTITTNIYAVPLWAAGPIAAAPSRQAPVFLT